MRGLTAMIAAAGVAMLVSCGPPPLNDLVRLEHALKMNDTNVIARYTTSPATANFHLTRKRVPYTFPIIVAAERGNASAVQQLLAAGADVNATNASGSSALIQLMKVDGKEERLQVLDILVANGADVNHKDYYGNDALSFAATYRSPEYLKRLLQAGADPNSRNQNGNTPLHNVGTVTNALVLLQAGSTFDVTNHSGQTPLDVAKDWRRTNLVRFFEGLPTP